MAENGIHIFGIRHHGPGSAQSLERALEALRPDCILVEGPPDADSAIPLAAHEQMQPPVALLVYVPGAPQRSAFYPFASFSPEWRAIQFGLKHAIPTRFMDLPQWFQLHEAEPEAEQDAQEPANQKEDSNTTSIDNELNPAGGDEDAPAADSTAVHRDPLGHLAVAAGFSDGERWWDYLVESRRGDKGEIFAAVGEAMTALRDTLPAEEDTREQRREAYMRKTIRAAKKEGFEQIAVVCGAWHAPALDPQRHPSIKHDNDLLKGMKKGKTEAAWSPWTYDRLAVGSGYGAGVVSPAWYELLWSGGEHVATQWMTRVARLMRDKDLDTSSAHVIEAVRLGETLAAMRNRPIPGLEELNEAALTVICAGEDTPMQLIHRKLVVGDRLGQVPDDAPMPPLQRDLAALQKRLRFPAKAEIKQHDFDLRKPMDLERSHLLYRLNLLNIPWGEPGRGAGRGKGTFHEYWQVQWRPEFVIKLIEAARFGNTVKAAAAARTMQTARDAENLVELTRLLDHALLADLPAVVTELVSAIQQRAATSGDVPQLMAALPPLAQVMRYGSVRQTDASMVAEIVQGILIRVCVGLSGVCTGLNDEAAEDLFEHVLATHRALSTLQDEAMLGQWYEAMSRVAGQESTHPLLAGRAVRILHDAKQIEPEDTARQMGFAISNTADRLQAAAWIEGFLKGSGLVLIHDTKLWPIIDAWVTSLDRVTFTEVLPLLRRTFSTFSHPERRQMGERVKHSAGDTTPAPPAQIVGFDHERAAQVLPLIAQLLGTESNP